MRKAIATECLIRASSSVAARATDPSLNTMSSPCGSSGARPPGVVGAAGAVCVPHTETMRQGRERNEGGRSHIVSLT